MNTVKRVLGNVKRIDVLIAALLGAMGALSYHIHEADHFCFIGGAWLVGLVAALCIVLSERGMNR